MYSRTDCLWHGKGQRGVQSTTNVGAGTRANKPTTDAEYFPGVDSPLGISLSSGISAESTIVTQLNQDRASQMLSQYAALSRNPLDDQVTARTNPAGGLPTQLLNVHDIADTGLLHQSSQPRTAASGPDHSAAGVHQIPTPSDTNVTSVSYGWTTVDSLILPYVVRDNKRYVSVRMVEHGLLSKYPSVYSGELKTFAPLRSQYITVPEMKVLNSLMLNLSSPDAGQLFTTNDLLVRLDGFNDFYAIAKRHFPEYNYKNAPVSPLSTPKNLSPDNDCETCGWLQVNNTVVPFIMRKKGVKMAPLSVIRYGAGLLKDQNIHGLSISEEECRSLNTICSKVGLTVTFSVEKTRLVELDIISMLCKTSITFRDLPMDDPFGYAEYSDISREQSSSAAEMPINSASTFSVTNSPPIIYPTHSHLGSVQTSAEAQTVTQTSPPGLIKIAPQSPTGMVANTSPALCQSESRPLQPALRAPPNVCVVPQSQVSTVRRYPYGISSTLGRNQQPTSDASKSSDRDDRLSNRGQPAGIPRQKTHKRPQSPPPHSKKVLCASKESNDSQNLPKTKVIIQPTDFHGKTVSCLVRETKPNLFQLFALVEAVCHMFFPRCSPAELCDALQQVFQVALEELSATEEEAFISFYGLDVNSLTCNKIVDVKSISAHLLQLNYIFKAKEMDVTLGTFVEGVVDGCSKWKDGNNCPYGGPAKKPADPTPEQLTTKRQRVSSSKLEAALERLKRRQQATAPIASPCTESSADQANNTDEVICLD